MKVQPIITAVGERYIVLDDEYNPVEVINRYLKYLDNIGKSPNTQKSYAYDLLIYYSFLIKKKRTVLGIFNDGNKGPIDVLSEFVMWLQYPDYQSGVIHIDGETSKRSNVTVNRIMNSVLEMYRYLAANKEVEELDVYREKFRTRNVKSFISELLHRKTKIQSSIFKKPVPAKMVAAVTREQYWKLYDLCTTRRDKIIIALMYEGGLRLGETLGIHLEDLGHIEDNEIKIVARENNENGARVKNMAEGSIGVPDYVVGLLLDYISEDLEYCATDYLFINMQGNNAGKPLKAWAVQKMLARLSKKAGIYVHAHMFRHGFAQEKLDVGWDLYKVQACLRHRNPTSTEVYCQYKDEVKIAAMRNFLCDQRRGYDE